MPDEHTTHTEEDARPSDSLLQRRTGNLRSPDSRSDGERDDSVEPDWSRPSSSNGQLQQDHLHEAELIDHFQGVVQAALTSIRVAPIPDPRELQEYENIEAGFANRIITMAEESAAAANTATLSNAEINNAVAESIREESRSIKRGQWMIVALAVLFLITAVILEFSNRTPFATGMGILGFLSLFGVLLRPRGGVRWQAANKDANDSSSPD